MNTSSAFFHVRAVRDEAAGCECEEGGEEGEGGAGDLHDANTPDSWADLTIFIQRRSL